MNEKNENFLENINEKTIESYQEEKFIKQKINYIKYIIQILIIAIAIVSAYFIFNKKTIVIDFTNMAYEDAAAWAESKDIMLTYDSLYSNDTEAYYIISQSIAPGEKIEKENNIVLTVSMGLDPYEEIVLPEFDSSWSKTSINRWLDQNGIENFTFVNMEDEEIPENYLISYRLIGAKEDDFLRSSEIEFTISKDVDSATAVSVQNFLNSSLASADIWAKNNGINYEIEYEYSSVYASDKIISQSINADEEINAGDTIVFTVSKGKGTITMENLLNKTVIEADQWAKKNGINYEIVNEYSSIYSSGKIMSQSVIADKEINTGDKIVFTLSMGNENTIMENFINKTIIEADIWAKNNGVNYEIEYAYSSMYSSDKIMGQSILEGSEIEKGRKIIFKVSKGEQITVPSFADVNKDEAKDYLKGITVNVVEKYMNSTKTGDFISQSIPAGTVVEEGTEITLEYSLGDTLLIPNYKNQLLVDFEEWVKEQNETGTEIKLTVFKDYNPDIEYGKIISQNIYNEKAGLIVDIEVLVSLGEAFGIPDFSGLTKNLIKSYAESNGITIIFEEISGTDYESGTVISQEPASGEIISKKDFVKIKLAE